MVIASGVCSAFMVYFARSLTAAGLVPVAVAFFRFAATVTATGRFVNLASSKRSATIWAMASGVGLGIGWVAYVVAAEELEVATLGAVYMTYPVFALLGAWALFRIRPTVRSAAGAALVVAGAAIAIGPLGGGADAITLLIAFGAPTSFGFVVIVLSERVHALEPLERIAATSSGALVALLPIVATHPLDSVVPDAASTWALAIGIGLLTSLLPMGLFVVGAPVVGSGRAAAAGGVELPTMFLIGWWLLGEAPTTAQIIGGAIIVTAVGISPTRPAPLATARPRPRRARLRPRRTTASPPPSAVGHSAGGCGEM